ncbi:MAG: hypothetical protein ABIF10_07470 [Candidatus Woesearchaeota archaeon]
MLDKERIKEAEVNVKSYLQEGLLRKAEKNNDVINILLTNGKESLKVAEEIQSISDLWVIVCSYYAMFYYANAALLSIGYKVGDKICHKVTADALISFVRQKLKDSLIEEYEETREEALRLAGLKADLLIESFDFERKKRSLIQYKTLDVDKRARAETSLKRGKEFTREMEKMLVERADKK